MPRPVTLLATATLFACACFDEPVASTDPTVFLDGFSAGVGFQAFAGSKTDAVTTDTAEKHTGTASLKITVLEPNASSATWAGGAFVAQLPRDLSGFDALTFWAKASQAAKLDVAGIGNDNTGTSRFDACWKKVSLTTEWTKIVVPIPLPEKLVSERGLFYLSEGAEGSPAAGYFVWIDDLQYEKLGSSVLGVARPTIPTVTLSREVDDPIAIAGSTATFAVNGVDQVIEAYPAYFTFSSSNSAVVTFRPTGTAVGEGTAQITARLGDLDASGVVTVNVGKSTAPPSPAPPPTPRAAGDVISLFSGAYSNVPVDTWRAEYSLVGSFSDAAVGGDAVKKYENLTFVGIEFKAQPIDATAMTAFHADVYTPDSTSVEIKLVDFGPNGIYDGPGKGDDQEVSVKFDATSSTPLVRNEWNSFDIPLSKFAGLGARAHLAQLIVAGSKSTVYLDNLYFHK